MLPARLQKLNAKLFTSAEIVSRQFFKQGRFEIKAVLPKGSMLSAAISLFSILNIDEGISLLNYYLNSHIHFGIKKLNEIPANYQQPYQQQATRQLSWLDHSNADGSFNVFSVE